MQSWKELLDRFHETIKEIASIQEGNLRFKAKFVTVSELAGQYYCEKKVELVRLHGEEETPEMAIGKKAHEELLKDSVKLKLEAVWRKIFAGEPVGVREMLLIGKHDGTIIAGVADAVYFYKTRPVALFEHKFSRKSVPFTDHHVQALLYCYLLQLMGFDVSPLKYVLVMAPPQCKGSDELRKTPSYVLKHLGEEALALELPHGKVNIYINPYLESRVTRDLEWALGFWRQQRDAKPTSKAGKCKVCQFQETCEYSLARKLG